MLSRAFLLVAVFLLAACGSARLPSRPDLDKLVTPHRIEIQQGNFISQEMVSQLKPGQTKDQVRFILGTPLIADSFHGDRWDYVFWRQRANSKILEQRKIAVFFADDVLTRVQGDVMPAAQADPGAIKIPEPAAAVNTPAQMQQAKPLPPAAQPEVKPIAIANPPAQVQQAKPLPPAPQPETRPAATSSPTSPRVAAQADPPPVRAEAKQTAGQGKPGDAPDLPGAEKRDTRSLWERLKDKMTF